MVIGIDLGGTNVCIGKVDGERLVEVVVKPSPANMELTSSIDYLKEMIRMVLADGSVTGIGVGVPSVVDVKKGIVYNVANIPSWEEVPLKDILESEFGLPVWINNDANCFTLGENRFGHGRNYKNVVGITLGTGVGAGIIIEGELYSGTNAGAGEIGCIPYLDDVHEAYCGSYFFAKRGTSGMKMAEKAHAGDLNARLLWDEFGLHMGKLIHTVLFAYDPEAIIFGGGISSAYPLFSEAMHWTMATFPYPKSLERLKIAVSDNPDIAVLGAAALVK